MGIEQWGLEPSVTLSGPVLAGWSARIVSAACALLNTRLLIELMGVDSYAALTIVLSLMPWLALLNLGLPNAAQNAIARARAASIDVARLRQTSLDTALLAGIVLVPMALGLAALLQHTLLAEHPHLSYAAVALLCAALLFNGFSIVFNQVLYALHRGVWPALVPAVQALLTSVALGTALVLGARSPLWGAAAVALPMLLVFGLSAWHSGAVLRWKLDFTELRTLLSQARGFLLFGTAAQLTLACDYVVMALLLPAQDIVEYNLASRAFGIILTLHTVLLAAAWTPMSDRFYRGEFQLLRHQVLRLLQAGAVLAVALALPLALSMDHLVLLLAGDQAPVLPQALIAVWLAYLAIRVWCDTFATALLSANQLSTMNHYVIWQAAVSVPAQWMLGSWLGTTGIVLGIIVSFLTTAAWVLPLRFVLLTRTPQPAPGMSAP